MQGNCSAQLPRIPAPALAPLLPGQCILVTAEDMLAILAPAIWLDNLYLRAQWAGTPEFSREDSFIALTSVAPINGTRASNATRYMTRMTFQGDNAGPTVGVFGDQKVFVEGATLLFCDALFNSQA